MRSETENRLSVQLGDVTKRRPLLSYFFIKPIDHPGHGDRKEDLQGAADDPCQDKKKGRDGHDDSDPPEIWPVFPGIPLVKLQDRKEYAEDQTCGGQKGEDDVKVSL